MAYPCPSCNGTGQIHAINPANLIFFGVWTGEQRGHFLRAPKKRIPYNTIRFSEEEIRPSADQIQDQIQGHARLSYCAGYTVLCCWDRTEDRRFGCIAAFFAPDPCDVAEMLNAIPAAFPKKWAQLVEAGGVTIVENDMNVT